MKTVYLASSLGFSPERRSYRDKIKQRLTQMACRVLDPWDQTYHSAIEKAGAIQDWKARVQAFKEIASQIGKANEEMIRSCDVVLGVLDGAELDSGTVSEIGFAAALGKVCYGLRSDFRDCGEFDGQPFNLQVLYWIESSDGRLFRRIEEIHLLWTSRILVGQSLPEEQMDSVNVMAAVILFCLGLITITVSIPLYLGKIKMNRLYGFRIPKAFESEENWYLINRYGAKVLMCWSVVMMVIGIVCLFIPLQSLLLVAIVSVVVLMIPLIQTLYYAKHL